MADLRETLAKMQAARDQLAEQLEANQPVADHATRTLLGVANRACSRLSSKLDMDKPSHVGHGTGAFTRLGTGTGIDPISPASFPAIPEAVIRAKQPATEPIAFSKYLLDIIAGFIEGTPVQNVGFVNTYVGNILAHTPSVPNKPCFARLHNRNCNFGLIISKISLATQFTTGWVKFLTLGAWADLWEAAIEADLGPTSLLRISTQSILLSATCEKAYSDSRNDVNWPWDLMSDEAVACLIMHAASPDIRTGAMAMLFYVGTCAPAKAANEPAPTREEYVHIRAIDGCIETLRANLHVLGGGREHDDSAVAGITQNDIYDAVFDSLQTRRCNVIVDAYGRGVHDAGVSAGIAIRGVIARAFKSGRLHLVIAELLVWACHQLGPRYAIYEVWQRVDFRYTCDCYGTEYLGDSGGVGLRSIPGFASVLKSHGLTGSVVDIHEAWASYYRLANDVWAGKSVDDWVLTARPLLEYYAWCVADGSDVVAYGKLADLSVGRFIIGRHTEGLPKGRTECRTCARNEWCNEENGAV